MRTRINYLPHEYFNIASLISHFKYFSITSSSIGQLHHLSCVCSRLLLLLSELLDLFLLLQTSLHQLTCLFCLFPLDRYFLLLQTSLVPGLHWLFLDSRSSLVEFSLWCRLFLSLKPPLKALSSPFQVLPNAAPASYFRIDRRLVQ